MRLRENTLIRVKSHTQVSGGLANLWCNIMKSVLIVVIVLCPWSWAQVYPDEARDGSGRALVDPEIAQIPDDILLCYTDRALWDRMERFGGFNLDV